MAKVALAAFTLAWNQPAESIRWQEDVSLDGDKLIVREARIANSGTDFQVPAGAVLEGGVWRYQPNLPPLPEIELANTGEIVDWQLCNAGQCRSLTSYVAADEDGWVLRACTD